MSHQRVKPPPGHVGRRGLVLSWMVILTSLVAACIAAPAGAQRMPVPAKLQGAILSRVLTFDRTLREAGSSPRVIIAYAGSVPDLALELIEGFGAAQLNAEAVEISRLREHIEDLAVVYVSPGVDPAAVTAATDGASVLLVTGVPSWVREGLAAVGIDSRDGKPKIVVSQRRLRISKHQLSADLLNLAEVVP